MELKNLSKQEVFRHIAIWICLAIYIFAFFSVEGPILTKIIFTFLFLLNMAIPYYLLLFYAIPFLFFKKWMLFLGIFLVSVIVFIAIDFIHIKLILPFFNVHRLRENFSVIDFLKVVFLRFLLIVFAATGVFFNRNSIQKVKEFNESKKILMATELDFLSNQFHSHLTFNFINFCHGHLLAISSVAAETFENFAGMLNYSLNAKPGKFISLVEEFNYIEYFIEVQRCITSTVFVDLRQEGSCGSLQILHGVLSVFVENAFKHGIYSDETNPIKIHSTIHTESVFFYIENKKENYEGTSPSGVGLTNIKQALEIFYKDEYSLTIENSDSTYIVKLNLKLNKA